MLDSTPVAPALRCAGLDVSMEHVDFFFSTGKEALIGRVPRHAEALGSLARQLRDAGAELVVLEASGGFEQAGLCVAVVNPRRVRYFARSLGLQAKTDRLDAIVLAQFGERLRPAPTPLPAAHVRRFQQLLRHLAEVVDQRARWRTTLHRAEEPARASLQRLIAAIGAEIRLLERQLDQAATSSPELLALTSRLQTAPGVGPKTAWMLAAELPELGNLSARQAASLAGLAPRARDSGAYRGRRTIGGGRPRVRRRPVRRRLERTPPRPRRRRLLRPPPRRRQTSQGHQYRRRQKTPRRSELHASTSLRLASRHYLLTQSLDTGCYT